MAEVTIVTGIKVETVRLTLPDGTSVEELMCVVADLCDCE